MFLIVLELFVSWCDSSKGHFGYRGVLMSSRVSNIIAVTPLTYAIADVKHNFSVPSPRLCFACSIYKKHVSLILQTYRNGRATMCSLKEMIPVLLKYAPMLHLHMVH